MVNVLEAINLPNSTNNIISQFYLNFRGTTLRGKNNRRMTREAWKACQNELF